MYNLIMEEIKEISLNNLETEERVFALNDKLIKAYREDNILSEEQYETLDKGVYMLVIYIF